MTNVSVKWPALVLVFLATLAAAFALGRCTGAGSAEEPPGYPPSYDDPLLSLPTTKDSIYVPLPQETVRVEIPAVVDTDAIISSYFSRHIYRDTLRASAPGKLGGFAVRKTSKSVTDRKEAVFISKTAPFCIENGFFFICNSFSNLKTQYTNDTKTRRFHNPHLRAHGACRDVSAASFAQPHVAQAARMDSCCTWTGAAASPAWLPPEPAHVDTKASRRDCRGAGRAVRATAAQK